MFFVMNVQPLLSRGNKENLNSRVKFYVKNSARHRLPLELWILVGGGGAGIAYLHCAPVKGSGICL